MPDLDELLNQVEAASDEIVALEVALVQIPSINTGVMPTGDETPVCEYARDWLAREGIEADILERAPNRGNLIARLDGRSGKAGLVFMSHTDVVPVEDESKWRFPPFSATIADGRIHGRGAFDCKGLLTAQLVAMAVLRRNAVELQDGLVLASGADEEHGGRYGFGWLAQEHRDAITAPCAVNEGGGTPIYTGGALTYVLGVGEKGRLQVEIQIKGASAHASVPWRGENALLSAGQALQRIQAYQPELDTSASLFDYLSTFAIEHQVSPANIDQVIQETEKTNPALASLMRGLSRMTITPTMVRGGIKSNVVPESVQVTCDVRILPHQDEAYVRRELERVLEEVPGVGIEIDYMAVPSSSPFETDLAERIKTAAARALDRENIQWVPAISTGFTDSRFMRPLGVTTYGFAGSHPDDDPAHNRVHGTDESIGIKSLVNSAKCMLALAYDLLAVK